MNVREIGYEVVCYVELAQDRGQW